MLTLHDPREMVSADGMTLWRLRMEYQDKLQAGDGLTKTDVCALVNAAVAMFKPEGMEIDDYFSPPYRHKDDLVYAAALYCVDLSASGNEERYYLNIEARNAEGEYEHVGSSVIDVWLTAIYVHAIASFVLWA